jgi:hypothetical protein
MITKFSKGRGCLRGLADYYICTGCGSILNLEEDCEYCKRNIVCKEENALQETKVGLDQPRALLDVATSKYVQWWTPAHGFFAIFARELRVRRLSEDTTGIGYPFSLLRKYSNH